MQYSCTPVFSYILYGYHPRVTENLQFKDKGRMLEDEKVTLFTRYIVYASTSVSGDICNTFSELERYNPIFATRTLQKTLIHRISNRMQRGARKRVLGY